MKKEDHLVFRNWFDEYVRSFYSDDPLVQQNIILKEEHSIRVCENASLIALSEKVDETNYSLAMTIALFHDIGRFEQFSKYRTFRDTESENHATLGVKVLKREGVLSNISREDRRTILLAIAEHNRFMITGNLDERTLFHAKLIRDADKLDIYKVLVDQVNSNTTNPALYLGFPDTEEYSPEIVQEILDNKVASVKHVRTCNDMNLTRLAWVFDINFVETMKLLRERKYIDDLIATLPENDEILSLHAHLNEYMASVLENNECSTKTPK
ncbi:HD domain-containing protein [Methanolobus profundi]|uniref:HDIG domain-containing protein n=1 Tax=Methanolobus profundi TaxID=487685 RepID=A0A1I4PNX2_9EURY|nr:HD domain-containing protein [Methanolobus profundi]SFM29532.1 HDIG domain-containing protein [Methanolobus profundi]